MCHSEKPTGDSLAIPSTPTPMDTARRGACVRELREQLARLQHGPLPADAFDRSDLLDQNGPALIRSGSDALDDLLPAGGFVPGSVVEFLSEPGSGAGTLALCVAREASRRGGAIVIVDRWKTFYPPAAVAWGVDLERLVIVRPDAPADQLWAVDQALRCKAVSAVWVNWHSSMNRFTASRRTVSRTAVGLLPQRWYRRLQLAAEAGGTLGLFLGPLLMAKGPTWADIQLAVVPALARQSRETSTGFGALPASLDQDTWATSTSTIRSPDPRPWQANWPLEVQLLRCRQGKYQGKIGKRARIEFHTESNLPADKNGPPTD